MKINVIKTLDKGMSNISASGVVDYCKAAENKTGEFNGKPYSFWTQFIVLKDDTGDIGVNLNLGDSKINVAKGQEIQIEKGTLDSYVKDGKTFQTLKARLHSVQNPSQQAPQPQQAKNPSVSTIVAPDSKNASICRQTAGKVVAQILSTHGFNSVKDMYNIILEVAVPLAKWFETGELPKVEEEPADERANSHGTYVTEIMPDSSITEEEESLPF